MHRTLNPEELLQVLRQPRDAAEVRARLRELLQKAWTPQWRKAVNKKPRPHKPKAKQSGAHTSVHKVLEAAKATKEKQRAPTSSG